MKTIVFLSNVGIQVLQGVIKGGQLTLKDFKTIPLDTGVLMNGVITNGEALKDTIAAAMEEDQHLFKSIDLLIDSSLIMTKNIEVPKLNKKALSALALSEFEDTAGNYQDLVVDYSSIPGPNGQNMFCCAVEKQILEPYVTLFESLKIKINAIDIGLNAIIKYVSKTRDYDGMSFALNIVDGNNLLSLLFENGLYIFSNRFRLMAERGSEAFASELSSRLSSLIQFNQSEKSEHSLVMSLYAGLDEAELDMLKTLVFEPDLKLFMLPQTPNIKSSFNVEDTFDLGKYLYPIAGFFTEKSDINLMHAYKQSNLVKKDSKFKNKALIAPLGLTALFIGVFTGFFILNAQMQGELDWTNEYINNEKVQAEYAQAQTLNEQVSLIDAEVANIETIKKAIGSNPKVIAEKISRVGVLTNGVIALNGMTYENAAGNINISATASNEQEAAKYIQRLKDTGYFTQVVYTGYAESDTTGTQLTTNQAATTTQTTTTLAQIPLIPSTNTSTTTSTAAKVYNFVVDAYLPAGGQS
ncbi:MAG: hypothetical protein ACOH15_08665 [Acetobacterium sp.]